MLSSLLLGSGHSGYRYQVGQLYTNSVEHLQEHRSSLNFESAVNTTTQIHQCTDFHTYIQCFKNGTYLRIFCCATYDNNLGITYLAVCPYFRPNPVDVISYAGYHYIRLPENKSNLNDYMCGPMNRKGRVCSECMDGYGPAMMSVGFDIQCSNCTGTWYGVPLFLFLEFFPTTVFYFIIILFQINITSGTITCFILYSQLVIITYDLITEGQYLEVADMILTVDANSKLFKIVLTVYDIWNLHFFRYLIPPFCVSSRLKPIHVAFMSYISVFYPLCLIVMTWVGVELYDRNFKPLVCLCRPLVRCLARLRRGQNARSDLINVFASFFLLSFSKVLFQFIFLLIYQRVYMLNGSSFLGESFAVEYDLSVPYGSTEHMVFAVPSVLIFCVLNFLPTLVLFLYPFRLFRALLSKCKLDGIALNTFVEKFYGCYRNGLDGGKDMRSYAGLYFVVRVMLLLPNLVGGWLHISQDDPFYLRCVFLTIPGVFVALCRPYKVAYMNVLDTLLLVHLGLLCPLVKSYGTFERHTDFVITLETMVALPLIGFILFFLVRGLQKILKTHVLRRVFKKYKDFHCNLTTRHSIPFPCKLMESTVAEVPADYGAIDIQHF